MSDCLICGHGVEPFMSFGRMPIANGFLTREQFGDENAFHSSTWSRMAAHFEALADRIKASI